MATAKKRQIKAELLKDPEYRAAWEAFEAAIARAAEDIAYDLKPDPSEATEASKAIFRLLDRRPDLAALVEQAEAQDH